MEIVILFGLLLDVFLGVFCLVVFCLVWICFDIGWFGFCWLVVCCLEVVGCLGVFCLGFCWDVILVLSWVVKGDILVLFLIGGVMVFGFVFIIFDFGFFCVMVCCKFFVCFIMFLILDFICVFCCWFKLL